MKKIIRKIKEMISLTANPPVQKEDLPGDKIGKKGLSFRITLFSKKF